MIPFRWSCQMALSGAFLRILALLSEASRPIIILARSLRQTGQRKGALVIEMLTKRAADPPFFRISLMCPKIRAARREDYPPNSIMRAACYLVTAFPVLLQTAIGTTVRISRSGTAGHVLRPLLGSTVLSSKEQAQSGPLQSRCKETPICARDGTPVKRSFD
jgi:hypothetical protein